MENTPKTEYFLGLSEEGFHRVVYSEWGEGNATETPIICVHGLTRNRRDFDSIASYLSKRGLHLYCPDVVGRGDSDWLNDPLHYTYEQYAADMNALIARTKAAELDWIGTSMGGLIGLLLASFPKTPIRKLVLNDIGPQIPVRGMARLSQYAGMDPDFVSPEAAKQYFKTIYAEFGDLTDEQWRQLTESSITQVAPNKFVTKIDHRVKLGSSKSKILWHALLHPLKALSGTFFDIELWHIWEKIKCPVLIVHGEQSDILLPHIIARMQSNHPNVEVLEVPGTGHAPTLFDPAHHEIIYQWLKK